MRILIVNGYTKNQDGYKKFSEFQYIIMKICAEQKELMDTETECFIRDRDNIDDFLYEIDSGFLKKEAAINFDQLDIVFISGDANIRPWAQSMKKIITLLRMCLKVQKHLFACGFGAQALVYLCASNIEKNIDIINGDGQGGKLTDIAKIPNSSHLKHSDYFLDNTTGDLYGFNYETSEWIPRGNVGLHYRRSAQEFQSVGKYVVQAPVYKPNTEHAGKYKFFKQRQYEETCSIRKMYLQHWALEGMDSEFIIPLKNTWEIHAFNFTNPDKTFQILADSLRGPLIFHLKSMLATMFPTNYKYPNSLMPIKNFILHTLKHVKSQANSSQKSIQQIYNTKFDNKHDDLLKSQKQKPAKKTLFLLNQRTQSIGYTSNQVNSNDQLKHVGFSVKKEHMKTFYSQNNIGGNIIKQQGGKYQSVFTAKTHSQINDKFEDIIKFQNNNFTQSTPPHSSDIDVTPQQGKIKVKRQYLTEKTQQTLENEDLQFTQGGVRSQLHPNLQKEFINYKKLWVPGQLSVNSSYQQKGRSLKTLSQTLTSHKSYYKQNDIQLTGVVNCITKNGKMFSPQLGQNNFLFSGEPYLTQDKLEKQWQLQEDKKIIGPHSFKIKLQSDQNCLTESDPVKIPFHKHVFRDSNKDKWVGNQFLLL